MDRIDPEHKLAHVGVKLARKRDMAEVSAMMIGRAKQAHHGIEDIEITDLEAESVRAWAQFLDQMRGWRVVLTSLAGDGAARRRRRRAVGDAHLLLRPPLRDRPAQGDGRLRRRDPRAVPPRGAACSRRSARSFGTFLGTVVCKAAVRNFPYGLVVNPMGLIVAWVTCTRARDHLRHVSGDPRVAPLADGGDAVGSASSLFSQAPGRRDCQQASRRARKTRPDPRDFR